MSKRDDGGPVAPDFEARTPNRNYPDYTLVPVGGMTLRQWYKGMCMPGVMAGVTLPASATDVAMEKEFKEVARRLGMIADALIAEDNEEK